MIEKLKRKMGKEMKVIIDRGSERWMGGASQDDVLFFISFKRWAREFITAGVNEVKVTKNNRLGRGGSRMMKGTSANNSVRAPEERRMSPKASPARINSWRHGAL